MYFFFFSPLPLNLFAAPTIPCNPKITGIPSTFHCRSGNKVSHFLLLLPPSFSHHTPHSTQHHHHHPCTSGNNTRRQPFVGFSFGLEPGSLRCDSPFLVARRNLTIPPIATRQFVGPFFVARSASFGTFTLLSRTTAPGLSRLITIACLRQLSPLLGFDSTSQARLAFPPGPPPLRTIASLLSLLRAGPGLLKVSGPAQKVGASRFACLVHQARASGNLAAVIAIQDMKMAL